ncbi:MAG: hypothetical protein HYX63_01415 [Gammaproteobacteria bacterium]|nr:hypothetical protein [Gammaproteobacteria bacterium]
MNDLAVRQDTVVATYESPKRLTAVDIRAQVNLIQEVMASIMKKDTHYGVIPGCKQPSLFKAGSEVLLTTFRISVEPDVEDISGLDERRYRVHAKGIHIPTGTVVGVGIGECSSMEEKYKWRKAYDKEWNDTPEDRRRVKHGRDYSTKQVRTEIADVSNTILKMAKKRAQVDMTLTALSASDVFAQDVEDLPEGYVNEEDRDQRPPVEQPKARSAPARTESTREAPPDEDKPLGEGALRILRAKMRSKSMNDADLVAKFGPIESLHMSNFNAIQTWIAERTA